MASVRAADPALDIQRAFQLGAEGLRVVGVESPQPLRFKRGAGYRERLVLGASMRISLAHMDLAPKDLQAFAQGIQIDLATEPKELAAVRNRGFATSHNELIEGTVAVAAPFFDSADHVAGRGR